jgi:Mrp family chromosome partitioning ATPase
VDGVLLVVDAHRTHRGALAQVREQLEQSGASVVGAIMNNFDPAKAKMYRGRNYGRYYPYGYRYSYSYGGRYGYAGEPDNGSTAAQVPLGTVEPRSLGTVEPRSP